jgi:hypothetical protein
MTATLTAPRTATVTEQVKAYREAGRYLRKVGLPVPGEAANTTAARTRRAFQQVEIAQGLGVGSTLVQLLRTEGTLLREIESARAAGRNVALREQRATRLRGRINELAAQS